MLTLIAIVLAVLVLPSPWGIVAVVGAAVFDIGETVVFWRWSKRRKAAVGVQTLVGRRAIVVATVSAREGQVKLDGEVWEARCDDRLDPGADVVVRGVDGLILDVTPDERVSRSVARS